MPETGASGSVGAPSEQSEGATRQQTASHACSVSLLFIPFTLLTSAALSAKAVTGTFSKDKVIFYFFIQAVSH
jgi:hypothetical protein